MLQCNDMLVCIGHLYVLHHAMVTAGVYSQGGPSVVDKRITMESLTDRTNSQSHNKRMTV